MGKVFELHAPQANKILRHFLVGFLIFKKNIGLFVLVCVCVCVFQKTPAFLPTVPLANLELFHTAKEKLKKIVLGKILVSTCTGFFERHLFLNLPFVP